MKTLVELPVEARAARLAMRHASHRAREARKCWNDVRAATIAGMDIGHEPRELEIGAATVALWTCEVEQAEAAAAWRAALAAREALPVAARWNLVDMERWASSQPLV